MTVEARHLNFFSPQLITNREIMNPIETNINIYNNIQMGGGYSSLLPSSGITTETPPLPAFTNSLSQKTIYNIAPSRKRSRDDSNSINPFPSHSPSPTTPPPTSQFNKRFSLFGQDISFEIHQQQLDIHHFISQHMENMRMEVEKKRKGQSRRLVEAIEISVTKRLKAKEEVIDRIGKLNWALEERVKSLCIENQLWRELAQSNEAAANALRTNLEQVLAQSTGDDMGDTFSLQPAAVIEDAESFCESNEDDREWHTIAESGCTLVDKKRLCRRCGKDESCVLILPCRHLCLCAVCGSSFHTCPVCKSPKTGSIHVNMK